MRLKVIFLGYLRELTQMDQTFSKNLIDNEIINQDILEKYVSKIKISMQNSLNALRWEESLNRNDTIKTNDDQHITNFYKPYLGANLSRPTKIIDDNDIAYGELTEYAKKIHSIGGIEQYLDLDSGCQTLSRQSGRLNQCSSLSTLSVI